MASGKIKQTVETTYASKGVKKGAKDAEIKFKELKALKEHIKEANRFADTRGKYEANKKVNKNIYRVDSFSEEQSLKRDKIQLSKVKKVNGK